MTSEAEGRLVQILRRELGASHVGFVPPDRAPEASEAVLVCHVENGPSIAATFDEPPADREAKVRRMEMIVDSFADLLTASGGDARHKATPPARSLAGELTALAGRAGAMAALVVDAASPVVWGASDLFEAGDDDTEESDVTKLYRRAAHAGLRFDALVSTPLLDTEGTHEEGSEEGESEESGPLEDELTQGERAELWRRVLLVRNALAAVRALPEVTNLHKGEHLHGSVRAPELSYAVRSFATIYLLLLVFERPFDELRAERSIAHALPTIERLVLALPPREPTPPMAGVGVMRLRRR